MMDYDIRLPTVLDATLNPVRRITPVSTDITLSIKPLSTANMTVSREDAPAMHDWVELFTPHGSAGIFRVATVDTTYGADTVKVSLEHGFCVLEDAIANVTATTLTYVAVDTRSTETLVRYSGTKEQVEAACKAYQATNPGYTPEWAISTEDNNTYFQGTPAAVLQQILSYQTLKMGNSFFWTVGTVEPTTNIKLKVDYDVCLDLIDDLMNELPDCMLTFDQTVFPWRVNILNRPNVVTAEGRLSRNLSKAEITYDDSELFTRVYMNDLPGGYLDADTVSTYGIIGTYLKAGDALSVAEKTAIATQYLNKHKNPMVSVELDELELEQKTGVSLDGVDIGRLYRLALPDYGIVLNEHITNLFYSTVYGQPGVVLVTLANDTTSLIQHLSEMKKQTKSAGGSASAKEKELEEEDGKDQIRYNLKVDYDNKHFTILATEEEWSDYWSDYLVTHKSFFEQTARHFNIIMDETMYDELETAGKTFHSEFEYEAEKLNLVFNETEYQDLQETFRNAGEAYMDATMFSLMFSHQDILNVINSRKTMFKMTQDQIALRVEKGNVATELTVEMGNVSISNGNLVVDGYVKADEFSGLKASFNNLVSGNTTATSLKGTHLEATSSFTFRSASVSAKTSARYMTSIDIDFDNKTATPHYGNAIAYLGWGY